MVNRKSLMILALVITGLLASSGCQQLSGDAKARSSGTQAKRKRAAVNTGQAYGPPKKLATIADENVDESSGLAASHLTSGVYWTHNDSGGGPYIYAFDISGAHRGVWRVTGASARDWEDIAVGPGPKANTSYLYIGDIGNNSGKRAGIVVYRVPEPAVKPGDVASTKKKPLATEPAETIRFNYPDQGHDAEALLVHPLTGRVYIVTKTTFSSPEVYAGDVPADTSNVTTLTRLGTLDLPSFFGGIITGGSISPDGQRVALCDYFQGYEIVLPNADTPFDRIWKQPVKAISIGKRNQGEAISYRRDGKALLVTSEGALSPLIQIERQ